MQKFQDIKGESMIVYTCPKCGGELFEKMIAVYPPIPMKTCTKCGCEWEGQPEIINFQKFDPEKLGYAETMAEARNIIDHLT